MSLFEIILLVVLTLIFIATAGDNLWDILGSILFIVIALGLLSIIFIL